MFGLTTEQEKRRLEWAKTLTPGETAQMPGASTPWFQYIMFSTPLPTGTTGIGITPTPTPTPKPYTQVQLNEYVTYVQFLKNNPKYLEMVWGGKVPTIEQYLGGGTYVAPTPTPTPGLSQNFIWDLAHPQYTTPTATTQQASTSAIGKATTWQPTATTTPAPTTLGNPNWVPGGAANYKIVSAPTLDANGNPPKGYRKFIGQKGEVTWGYSAEVATGTQTTGIPTGGYGRAEAVYANPQAYGIQPSPGYEQTPSTGITGGLGNWKDWLSNAPAQLKQLLSQLPVTGWLSNLPNLPQSTIPTPTVEYPAPGRPPEYTNPFAWRRKGGGGWW